jgi:hypothetical protein
LKHEQTISLPTKLHSPNPQSHIAPSSRSVLLSGLESWQGEAHSMKRQPVFAHIFRILVVRALRQQQNRVCTSMRNACKIIVLRRGCTT